MECVDTHTFLPLDGYSLKDADSAASSVSAPVADPDLS